MSKLLIDKLRRAATVCVDWDASAVGPPFDDWASLMDEAADMIEGLEDTEEYTVEHQPFEWNENTDIRTAVFESLGAASVCWDNIEHAGVFQSQKAIEIGDQLLEFMYARQSSRD